MPWDQADLAEKLWTAAYAVTAFATAQGMSYLYALAGDEFNAKVRNASGMVSALIIVCHLLYIAAIVGCHIGIGRLVAANQGTSAGNVNIVICTMQVLAVVAVGALAFAVTSRIRKEEYAA